MAHEKCVGGGSGVTHFTKRISPILLLRSAFILDKLMQILPAGAPTLTEIL